MPAETDVLRALFAASTGIDGTAKAEPKDDLWTAFLTLLGTELRASAVALHVETGDGSRHVWCVGQIGMLSRTQVLQMRLDRTYSQIDLPGNEDRREPLRAVKVAVGPIGFAVLALYREGQDFRAADGVQLSALCPFLGQALLTWRSLEAERQYAALDHRVAAGLGGGWVMLSTSGAVTAISQYSKSVFDGLNHISLRSNGWLELGDPSMRQQFRQAIAAGSGLVTLSHEPLIELEITADNSDPDTALIGFLRRQPIARLLSVDQVVAHFGLSRSEARLAILICDGFNLQEGGQELGWTIETTRSVSKQIFARMGVRSQSAVMRKVLSSSIWLSTKA